MSEQPDSMLAGTGPVVDRDHPWPGLASFRERDQTFFKGREHEVEELRRTVASQRLTVLFGASGLGKTSLLRAGLFPALRAAGELPVYIRLDFAGEARTLREQVFSEVLSAAAAHNADAPRREADDTLWTYFHRRDAAFWSERNRLLLPVLVFDQFEEVFSLGLDDSNWRPFVREFLDELADLVEGRAPAALKDRVEREIDAAGRYDFVHHRYRVVISLREDYLAPLEQLRDCMPSIAGGRYRLQPMSGEQAFRVVDQTKGRLVEAPVARKIVRFAAGRSLDDEEPALTDLQVDPSLLGLFCRELNERREALGAPKITEELVRSNQGNILEDFYEACMRAVRPELRRFVEDELVTARGHRDSRAAEDALLQPGITAEDLASLVNARLLRMEDRGGTRRLELTHDVLTAVVRAARDRRHAEERIQAERSAERERLHREKEAAERERLEREARLARVEADRARDAERSSRRFRWLASALALALVGSLALAWWAREQSNLATERAAQAETALAALYNSIESHRRAQAEAERARRDVETVLKALTAEVGKPQPRAAVQRLEEARQVLENASADIAKLQRCAVKPRVYVHIRAETDRTPARNLAARLEREGFTVPGIERRDETPRTTEVRYFRKDEADGAAIITAVLRRHHVQNAATTYVRGYEASSKIRPCHYEIWFSEGAFANPEATPGAATKR